MIHNPCYSTQPSPVLLCALDGDHYPLRDAWHNIRTFTRLHEPPDRTGRIHCQDTRTGVTSWFYPSSLQEVI